MHNRGGLEEPGSLEQVAALARDWFVRHVASADGESHHAVVLNDDDLASG